MGETGQLEVVPVCTGVFQQNCQLLFEPSSREALVIDPGEGVAEIEGVIARLGLKPLAITNTHSHLDHVAGVAEYRRRSDLAFHLHPAERPILEAAPDHCRLYGLPPIEVPAVDHDLAEGQVFTLGGVEVKCLLAPGHTPGSICFYGGGQVVVGDVLFAGSIGRTDLPGGEPDKLPRSIREVLYTLPDDTRVHSGHGPVTTIGHEARTNPFVRR